ncbi:MAG: hypothetical protein HFG80_00565 [Eubacterium sp.]|nr:hypothetical protein [Eubacterium sp.]
MKRKIIVYILIGSLSAMCLCSCGSKTGSETETNTVTESAENSGEETEAANMAGSSDEEEKENTENTGQGKNNAESGQNTESTGQDKDMDGTGQNTENITNGTAAEDEMSGTAETERTGGTAAADGTAGADSNASSGSGTADSDALDVSWGVIEQYGFRENQESELSFGLKGDTLVDCGDFFTIEATFYKPVLVSLNHEAGDVVEIVVNELTGERILLTYQGNGAFRGSDEIDYYTMNPAASGPTELYCFSEDQVEAAFYEGIIKVAKDAKSCIHITGEETPVSAEFLSQPANSWYNGVVFDDKKQAVTLTVYGD